MRPSLLPFSSIAALSSPTAVVNYSSSLQLQVKSYPFAPRDRDLSMILFFCGYSSHDVNELSLFDTTSFDVAHVKLNKNCQGQLGAYTFG